MDLVCEVAMVRLTPFIVSQPLPCNRQRMTRQLRPKEELLRRSDRCALEAHQHILKLCYSQVNQRRDLSKSRRILDLTGSQQTLQVGHNGANNA